MTDLHDERDRHDEVYAAQRHECLHERRQGPSRQELRDGALDAVEALLGEPDRLDVLLQHDLVGGVLERLLLEPAPVPRAQPFLNGEIRPRHP